jgi:hypothetical protein
MKSKITSEFKLKHVYLIVHINKIMHLGVTYEKQNNKRIQT